MQYKHQSSLSQRYLDFFPENLGSVNDGQGERFQREIKLMKCHYQGWWGIHMMADYSWSLVRNRLQSTHKRKALKIQFAPNEVL